MMALGSFNSFFTDTLEVGARVSAVVYHLSIHSSLIPVSTMPRKGWVNVSFNSFFTDTKGIEESL